MEEISDRMENNETKLGATRLSWNPNIDPVTEERLALFAKSDMENWQRIMRIVFMNRRAPVSFSKRKIQWT